MTTFTDKELIKEIKERIGSLDVRDNIERRAYEIALASLEAEPVARLHSDNGLGIPAITRSKNIADSWLSNGWYVQPLYIAQPVPVIPDEVLSAIREVARIRADFDDFDGDRRGIGDCLDEAEQELIVTINKYASQLAVEPVVPAVLERLRTIVADPRALPRRKEWVSGQQYSYVLLENVEAMVDEACHAAMLQGSQPVSQTYNLPELIEGMEVSIDVSTCDADLGNRYFGTVTEALELDTAKNGYILLVQDAEPNFDVNGNSPGTPDSWISCSDRMPEKGQNVLISVNFDSSLVEPLICSARYTGSTFRRGDATIKPGNGIEQATHWMPLTAAGGEVMNNLMIDLETMGKNKDAPIVSIGAVFFTPETGDIGQEFYTVVSLESAMGQGATPDGDTILWWLKQSPEARAAICIDDTLSISDALSELNHFINRHAANTKYLKVWGNGATFDNVILRGAYERAGQICPWAYWNDHDVRTIVTLGRSIGFDPKMDIPFDGERHNALADARHQAKYVSAIWQKLIPATSTEL